jgi:acetyl-CoA synthetase
VLSLLALLARAEDGMRADEVAEALGKSTSTAYNLLDTLCQEGFASHSRGGTYHLTAEAARLVPAGRAHEVPAGLGGLLDTLCQEGFASHSRGGTYHLTAEAARLVPAGRAHEVPAGLGGLLDELFVRTHKRVYLAAAQSGQVVIPLARGRQGMPRIPGLGARIGGNAHALALGKVALSLLSERALERYVAHGLRGFTPATITSPEELRAQLAEIRAGAVAYDREEFGDDFCCLALPVHNGRGQAVAALGISMSARCFALDREPLSEVLRGVVAQASQVLSVPAVPAISEDTSVLERAVGPTLGSGRTAVPIGVSTGEEATP